jgi:Zn-dependent protease with chaperone function
MFPSFVRQLMLYLPYSRQLEKEADKVGIQLAARVRFILLVPSVKLAVCGVVLCMY